MTIAVAGIALLLYRSKKSAFAHAFNTFYGVGLFFLLLGIGSMFALVIVNGAEYLVFDDAPIFGQAGSEAIGGDRSSGDNAYTVFKSLIAGIPQVVFFIGMALSLFVSSFIIHALIEFCLTRYEFFGNASTRAKELKALTEEFEECRYKYDLIAGTKKRAKADLPIDPESHFAKTASAKANSALHQMSRHLTTMLRNGGQLDVLQAGLSEKNDIPPHIKSLEDWQKLNAEIGDVIRPYAILNALGAIPPKEQG